MIYGLTGALVVAWLAGAARTFWARDAARRALAAGRAGRVEWRISCLAARLLVPGVLAFVLLLLISVAFDGPLTTQRWAVALAVLTGVIGNHVDREVASGWAPYWQQCHDSLRAALPTFPDGVHPPHGTSTEDCQALQFNIWHTSLLHREERDAALRLIFSAHPHP